MINFAKKAIAIAMVATLSCGTALAVKEKNANDAKVFVGLAYVAAENGASNEATAAIGVAGVIQAGIDGAVYGAVFGLGVGAVAGATVSL